MARSSQKARSECGRLLWKYNREDCVGTDTNKCSIDKQPEAYYSYYKGKFKQCVDGREEYEQKCIEHVDAGHSDWKLRLLGQSNECDTKLKELKKIRFNLKSLKASEPKSPRSPRYKSPKSPKSLNVNDLIHELQKQDILEYYIELFKLPEYSVQIKKKIKDKKDSVFTDEYKKLMDGELDINTAIFDERIKDLNTQAELVKKTIVSKNENVLLNKIIEEKNKHLSQLKAMPLKNKCDYIKEKVKELYHIKRKHFKDDASFHLKVDLHTAELDFLLYSNDEIYECMFYKHFEDIMPDIRFVVDLIYKLNIKRLYAIKKEYILNETDKMELSKEALQIITKHEDILNYDIVTPELHKKIRDIILSTGHDIDKKSSNSNKSPTKSMKKHKKKSKRKTKKVNASTP